MLSLGEPTLKKIILKKLFVNCNSEWLSATKVLGDRSSEKS